MSDKISKTRVWNILCFIALGLFAVTRFFDFLTILDIGAPWFGTFLNICRLLIGIILLISAWNAVAHEKKGWRITYWVFLGIVLATSLIPLVADIIKNIK